MSVFSRMAVWRRPAPDILLVADGGWFAEKLQTHLISCGTTCEIVAQPRRHNHKVLHFLQVDAFLKAPLDFLNHCETVLVTLTSQQLQCDELRARIQNLKSCSVIVDCTATRKELLQIAPHASVHVICEGIALDAFSPARIDRRLSARRDLLIPAESVCIGLFERLSDEDLRQLQPTLRTLQAQLGEVCLLTDVANLVGNEAETQMIGHRPQTVDALLQSYWSLDLYLSMSSIGDLRGILRSWAAAIPIAAMPSRIGDDLLRDGMNAAIAERSTPESLARVAYDLHHDEGFRHGCCQRGIDDVRDYDWPKILANYEQRYLALRTDLRAA